MAEENKVNQNNQNAQKDFTKKAKYEKKLDTSKDIRENKDVKEVKDIKDTKKIIETEKADLKFNAVSNSSVVSVNIPESKFVTATVKAETKTVKVNGKVICVSPYSYIVKTKDGSGVLVMGNHNKKIGDII